MTTQDDRVAVVGGEPHCATAGVVSAVATGVRKGASTWVGVTFLVSSGLHALLHARRSNPQDFRIVAASAAVP
jgi:hypothetical protein